MNEVDNDGRYWIMNPTGHRHDERKHMPEAGTMVKTVIGDMLMIAIPEPDSVFVCDLCNATIPHKRTITDEPLPIGCIGSYALCDQCRADIMDREDIPFWSTDTCLCFPCTRWGRA